MNPQNSHSTLRLRRRGMTLIELTVVISVLLALVALLFLGARIYKRGSDRAHCIMNIRQMQLAVRSFSNLNEMGPGMDTSPIDLESALIGADQFVNPMPVCPAGGTYTLGGNTIPPFGTLYLTCSLDSTEDHEPEFFGDW